MFTKCAFMALWQSASPMMAHMFYYLINIVANMVQIQRFTQKHIYVHQRAHLVVDGPVATPGGPRNLTSIIIVEAKTIKIPSCRPWEGSEICSLDAHLWPEGKTQTK